MMMHGLANVKNRLRYVELTLTPFFRELTGQQQKLHNPHF